MSIATALGPSNMYRCNHHSTYSSAHRSNAHDLRTITAYVCVCMCHCIRIYVYLRSGEPGVRSRLWFNVVTKSRLGVRLPTWAHTSGPGTISNHLVV